MVQLFMMKTFLLFSVLIYHVACRYEPTWESLDKRPRPEWFDKAKFGIMIHWGVYSVPSYGTQPPGEWFWWYWQGDSPNPNYAKWVEQNYGPDWTYADFGPLFKAELYDPNRWADIFKAAGAEYIAFTAKHHEGYTMWPSKYSFSWNSMDVGPHRDLVGELEKAIRSRTDIHFGLYYSLFEWFNPLYLRDKANGYKTRDYVFKTALPPLYELVNTYKPDLIWSDGDWMVSSEYWNSTGFLAWLYNDSPVKDKVVVNDRWGHDANCHHGDYFTCQDRYNPRVLEPYKWENVMFVDSVSAGYRRDAPVSAYWTIEQLLTQLAETVSCGGNLLMDIGVPHDGSILPIFEERLRQFGSWLGVNGEAIYSSKPWKHQNDTLTPGVWYTSKKSETGGTSVYAIVLKWPKGNKLTLGDAVSTSKTKISMLGYSGSPFKWTAHSGGGLDVTFPAIPYNELPCKWAWVLKMENLA